MTTTSHFDKLVDDEKAQAKDACIALPLGEPLRHAELKGFVKGLDKAKEIYHTAIAKDLDEAA